MSNIRFLPQSVRAGFFRCLSLWVGLNAAAGHPVAGSLSNRDYQVILQTDRTITVTGPGGQTQNFAPNFTVLYRADLPQMKSVPGPDPVQIVVPQWNRVNARPTVDYFDAGAADRVTANAASISPAGIEWRFPDQPAFSLRATVVVPAGPGEPKVTYVLTPKIAGSFSVGYTGSPQLPLKAVESFLQPDEWHDKRFPAAPVLSTENMCSLTTALVNARGCTFGLVADPGDIPFRMPMIYNASCGVMIRNEAGLVQPMFFAPVLGESNSWLEAGQTSTASFRITVRPGTIYDSFKHLATGLYGVRDFRQNTLCSLNTTIENMIAFGMNDYLSRWNADLRGYDYSTDVSNTVKIVSALDPLSIAVITDDQNIFELRAVPMIEYLLSRGKFLFTTDTDQHGQGASSKMAGPTGSVFEWSSLYHFSKDRTPVFRNSALELFNHPRVTNGDDPEPRAKWVDTLAMYQLTGNGSYLATTEKLADRYLAQCVQVPQTSWPAFTNAQFWTDFSPRWMQLFELYQDSGERRYLEGAVTGAREYATYCAMSPKVPDGNVTLHMTIYRPGTVTVPAWRPSNVGLTPEAANTYTPWNPAIFMATFSSYFLRIAALSHDAFLRDIARDAIVGRYANYPGYTINREFSTAYEPADYPLTPPPRNHRYSQFYFNHIWPQIALLMDYLISDAVTRSGGMIDFPSRYAQGYAYLQSKVYGDRPGTFYGDTNVFLYMPRQSVKPDNIQLNTISARGNGNFYVALMNQSAGLVTTTVTVEVPGLDMNRTYACRLWVENKPAAPVTLRDGKVTLAVAGHGITAVAIDNLNPVTSFQNKVFSVNALPLAGRSFVCYSDPEIKAVHGMMMTFGRGLGSVYVWLSADSSKLARATLCYRFDGGDWQEMTDPAFPFEFHVPMNDLNQRFEFYIRSREANGHATQTATKTLWKSQ